MHAACMHPSNHASIQPSTHACCIHASIQPSTHACCMHASI
jgi:hypothetical protein